MAQSVTCLTIDASLTADRGVMSFVEIGYEIIWSFSSLPLSHSRSRVPTSTRKPGKSQIKVPCMEKSWNLKTTEKSWKNHGIL